MANHIKITQAFRLLSALSAFILWGGWAFFINRREAVQVGITSGMTQGAASFLMTLFLVHAVTRLYHQFNHPIAKVLLPATVTVSFTSACLVVMHYIVQTPHILATVIPAISVAFTFCLFTTYKLHKASQSTGTDNE